MGAVAAAAVALATLGAAAVGGVGVARLDVPLVVLAVALATGVAGAAARRSPRVLPPGKDVVVLTAVTVLGFVGLYLAGWSDRQHITDVARLLPLGIVALSALWPEPNILRYCLLLAAGTLLSAAGAPVTVPWAVGATLAAMAVALVATNRLTAVSGPRLGGPAPTSRRRVAGEAAVLLAVVGLLAALAASLLPPPPGQGGGGSGPGASRSDRTGPAGPPVNFGDRLDVGAGRAKPGNEVVLRVSASAPDLWRATTYDHWDGEAWVRSPDGRLDTVVSDGVIRPGIGDPSAPATTPGFVQRVTVQSRSMSVVVAAARPTEVTLAGGTVRQGDDASVFPSRPLARGDRYFAASQRSQADPASLRALGEVASAGVPTDVADAYLQLPQLSPRVRTLAADVTSRAATTYDKARAIEEWLLDNTSVTDSAKAVPAGTDPLEAFLFDDRAGPPERASTSFAVMLRALGIPARMAVGFLPGRWSTSDRQFVVRASDSYAWVEVWFPGVGWQRFDPSGKAPDPVARHDSVWDRLWRFLRRLWPLLVLVGLVVGAWAARRALRWWRRRSALPWSTTFFARMERAGAARGRPRRPEETPMEYADGLAQSVLPDPRLLEVGELVTVAAWSRHEPAAADRARAEAVLRQATKAAPVPRLRRLPGVNRSMAAPVPTIPKP
jgi:transglutaminase-like putative cysteine protease